MLVARVPGSVSGIDNIGIEDSAMVIFHRYFHQHHIIYVLLYLPRKRGDVRVSDYSGSEHIPTV